MPLVYWKISLSTCTFFRMVKLTADVIAEAAQLVNPCRERELNLRSYKFSVVENLGATLDQFDTINMNDNDIKKLENFPYFQRLKILYLANNRIRKISPDIAHNLPNLEVTIPFFPDKEFFILGACLDQ